MDTECNKESGCVELTCMQLGCGGEGVALKEYKIQGPERVLCKRKALKFKLY